MAAERPFRLKYEAPEARRMGALNWGSTCKDRKGKSRKGENSGFKEEKREEKLSNI